MNTVKIRHENTTNGTIFGANTAFGTKAIIYASEIILDLNSTRGTILFALFTTDTSV